MTRGLRESDDPRWRALEVLLRLGRLYPDAACSLRWRTPYELLVATVLSAQCTDVSVNAVTPGLFARFPDATAIAEVAPEDLEPHLRSIRFYRQKSRSIVAASRLLLDRHGGQVPTTMEALLELPGVARKTANLVLAVAYGINAGVTVDTHVTRLARRLGLSQQTDPRHIESDLMRLVPQAEWENLSIRLIVHGRTICTARGPACAVCRLVDLCPSQAKG